MMRNRSILTLSAVACMLASSGVDAVPMVIVNQGLNNECQITPSTSTVFTLSTEGNVLISGSYSGSCAGTQQTPTTPTFTPFSPAPADLTLSASSLSASGGNITPNFVVYYANTCTGKVTATAGCPAIPAPWGSGGTVCSGATNGSGQTYCSPGSATVAVPANNTSATCAYTFQAINCTNGTASVNSQNAVVNVSNTIPTNCTEGQATGDLSSYGYTRQCSGSVHSFNSSLHPSWTTNTYADVMSANWPGSPSQFGFGVAVTVNALQFGSFKFNTGTTAAGVHFETNQSYGQTGLISVSTSPGDYFAGTVLPGCIGSTLNISSKSGTLATCKLSANADYYINFSMAAYSAPHATTCAASSCATGWTTYSYGN